MKTSVFLSLFVAGFAITRSAPAAAGGSGSAGGQGSGSAATTVAPAAQNPSPGSTQGSQLPPGSQNVPPAITMSNRFAADSNFLSSNQFGMNSNQFQSNNLSPTGSASGTNQSNNNLVQRDQAETDNDQALLVTLRQSVQTQLGITSPADMSVHFLINNGVVIIVGFVPTADQRQRVLLRCQRTAGVVQINNRLQVGTPPTTASPYAPAYVGVTTDHAFSASDQNLLTTVQQEAAAQLGINQSPGTALPVHFSIERGVVGISGQVATEQQKQAIASAIARTTGVVRVVDNLSVQATTPNGAATGNGLSPTSNGQTNSTIRNNFTNSGM